MALKKKPYCDFSETQFSFCFTFELIKRYEGILPIPKFLNTRREGEDGGGYDVGFVDPFVDGSLFFQFKIPKYFERPNRDRPYGWTYFKGPFYRISIETDETQFKLLKDLKGPANNVFYAAPEFAEQKELEQHYNRLSICPNSALFEINDFPNPLTGYHNLGYTAPEVFGWLFSDPKQLKKSSMEDLFSISPERMTLSEKASNLRSIIMSSADINMGVGVGSVFSILFLRFNILWLPILTLK